MKDVFNQFKETLPAEVEEQLRQEAEEEEEEESSDSDKNSD